MNLPVTPRRLARIRAVLERRQPDLTVVADRVHKPHNLAAILRTCDGVGVGRVHAVAPDPAALSPCPETAAGSHRWVEVVRHDTVAAAIAAVRAAGMAVWAVHLSPRAVDFREVDYTRPAALLVGAEKQGPSDEAVAAADGEVVIPMFGMVESFNVSVACALVLMEARSQRERAGLYDRRRLSDEEYHRLLVEWAHPAVARFCRRRGLPYPPLEPDGSLSPEVWRRLCGR
ncbi:MAG: tRNA (guanosine(18)-2'-O)-methyltransferase [Porticoccaceae bacterium]|nr:MAG: tRNA (guanosine(18)-2'-O)-methyltransferase [Porticoccaceae bacterium]